MLRPGDETGRPLGPERNRTHGRPLADAYDSRTDAPWTNHCEREGNSERERIF
jgi:hypothetical protein